MKKIIAMLLCFVMLGTVLVACTDKEDPGPEITMYMEKVSNFDPALAYNNRNAEQLLSLIYQGLVYVDEDGEVESAMAESWSVKGNIIEFRLHETKWSDGTAIQAKDFVYAWKRILDPEFQCSAASLLMYVKNAAEVKNGDTSIDNLGLYASGSDLLTVELIDGKYADAFLQNCASVALSPLREDKVEKIKIEVDPLYKDSLEAESAYVKPSQYSWATLSSVMLSNGPFYVKEFCYDGYDSKDDSTDNEPSVVLERNKYYFYDTEEDGEALREYVDPYRLNIKFVDAKTAYEKYSAGEGLFINNIPLNKRAEVKSKATIKDQLSTYSYLFNKNFDLFSDNRVTQALSLALDRNKIASEIVFGKAATGLLTDTVWNHKAETSFRKTAGDAISTSADLNKAKSLLKDAGVTGGAFTITIRKGDEVEAKVAELAKSAWSQLGFEVTIEPVDISTFDYLEYIRVKNDENGVAIGYEFDKVYSHLLKDEIIEKYRSGEGYQVLGIHLSMMSADPFAALAQFARRYSGGAYDFSESADHFELIPGSTGYASDAYDKLLDKALKEKDAAARATILAEAEKLLLKDAPVAPVYFEQSAAIIHENLEDYTVDYAGRYNFTEAMDATYEYVPEPVALIPAKKNWD